MTLSMTNTTMTTISEHLKIGVTPQYLAYASVAASIRDLLLVAAAQDAEVVYHLLLASALVDQTELRLDKPPAIESKFQKARLTLANIIERAGAPPPAVSLSANEFQAVKAFIKAVEEYTNSKEEMRATGEVTKVFCVLTSTAVASRSSARLPPINVAWQHAAMGTAEDLNKFTTSVRNFAAMTGRRKLLAMFQGLLLGPHVPPGGELVVDVSNPGAGSRNATDPEQLACEGLRACCVVLLAHGGRAEAIQHVMDTLRATDADGSVVAQPVVMPLVSSAPLVAADVSMYQVDVGDQRVDDRLMHQLATGLTRATGEMEAVAGHGEVPAVDVRGVWFELGYGAQSKSYAYIAVQGDLASRARSLLLNGKQFSVTDVPAVVRPSTVWVWAARRLVLGYGTTANMGS